MFFVLILGIETSCDETAAAIVEDGTVVRSSVIASSLKDQEKYGGVFPEVAARRQLEYIVPVIHQAIKDAGITREEIDVIAVTKGPGLLTSLLVGTTAARMLSSLLHKPLIGVHHTLGHLSSVWLECEEEVPFPVLSLSVSGGHTELWLRQSHTQGTLLGRTRDDAAGEAFDKGATLLGLPYPGGPALSKLAEGGNPHFIEFPRPLSHNTPALSESERQRGRVEGCDFSFSGLKTALKYALRDRGGIDALSEIEKKDVAASFQEAINAHLVAGIDHAIQLHHEVREIHLVGGVSANKRLREMIQVVASRHAMPLRMHAKMAYCTDNAAMIALAGYFLFQSDQEKAYEVFETQASPSLQLG